MKPITYTIDKNGCHLCTSHKPDAYGYPRATVDGVTNKICRLLYVKKKGYIAPNLVIRHTCNVRNCINVDHITVGTVAENNNDRRRSNRKAGIFPCYLKKKHTYTFSSKEKPYQSYKTINKKI